MVHTRYAGQKPQRFTERPAPAGAVQLLFGNTEIDSSVRYPGVELGDAIGIAEQINF